MVSAVLLYPPITDPTAPYHSLVYVASYARSAGFSDVRVRDVNVAALEYCGRPEVLYDLRDEWRRRYDQIRVLTSPSSREVEEYLRLAEAVRIEPTSPSEAIEALRCELFYDYNSYAGHVTTLKRWLRGLSCSGYPGQYRDGFGVEWKKSLDPSSVADLTDYDALRRLVGPLARYFEQELFPELDAAGDDVIGVGITYTDQLPYALWLIWELRERYPNSYIVAGGTEVSACYKYAASLKVFGKVFAHADACVVGEGETAFASILKQLDEGGRPAGVQNTVMISRDGCVEKPTRIAYERVEDLPSPDYKLCDAHPYWSPEPVVYYSPTRGCYWNKCTFCDYGLNFGTPTSPWRQRAVATILEDLRHIAERHRYVYLSVDVLAPAAITRLAEAIIGAEIDIRWAAEMRLESYFTMERCALLKRSGCVAVSVGFETGCQRILDAIAKGTKLDAVAQTIRNFAAAGVAVQLMGFTGFPTETWQEASESLGFVEKHSEYWAAAGIGDFVLTPGAIIAQQPQKFGISQVQPAGAADICRYLDYVEERVSKSEEQRKQIVARKRRMRRPIFDRPFAGGIDSSHSMLYYGRYGRAVPWGSDLCAMDFDEALRRNCLVLLNGNVVRDEGKALWMLASDVVEGATPSWWDEAGGLQFVRSDGVFLPFSEELDEIAEHVQCGTELRELLEVAVSDIGYGRTVAAALIRTMWDCQILLSGGARSHEASGTEVSGELVVE